MKILISRDYAFPSQGYGQNLRFDDGSIEWDAGATQTTPILTAEKYNGRAAKNDQGEWVPAPGARIHEYDESLLGFRVGLTMIGMRDGQALYDYSVTTPTGVVFSGDGINNVLCVPSDWSIGHVVGECISWICLGEDTCDTFPSDTTPEQWEWIRSEERQKSEDDINCWFDKYYSE